MTRPPRPLPSRFANTPFLVRDALASGIARDRLRRPDLVTPARGVRLPASADELLHRLIAVGLLLRADQHLSHVSAAVLWRCPLPRALRRVDATIHVSTVGTGPVERRREVVGHRVAADRAQATTVFGTRVSAPAAAWYECRKLLSPRDLVILGDHMVGVGRLATLDQLSGTIRAGDRDVIRARSAVERVRSGAESPAETSLRLMVVDAGFPEPELNVDVHAADGRFIGRADMAWPELRIALEYDGDHRRTDRDAFRRDRSRGNDFTSEDWIVIRATSGDLVRPATVFEHLRRAFEHRRRVW
ncbi:hypothetical protein [Curtobacterium sp. L1-20]|uniref:hypothetical protein n=1 Tax=Curtobacterium sp. L1-20 TaxID=3138181 RepID=UPI003B525908